MLQYNGRLHRAAYLWNPEWRQNTEKGIELPRRVNICPFFWRLVFALIVAWPCIWLARAFGWAVRIIGFMPMLVLFGFKPAGASWRLVDESNEVNIPFVRIERWPKIGNMHFMPGVIALVSVFVAALGFGVWKFIAVVVERFILGSVWGAWMFGILATLMTAFIIVSVVKKTQLWQLTRAFFKAKKERYCVELEFK